MTSPAPRRWRTMIVDDEPVARLRLRRLLESDERVSVEGEAGDASSAIAMIAELEPDIVLLDVQMRGPDGFDVAAALGDDGPAVVFVTAYDEFALRAFDAHAVDYVLKPVEPERLSRALSRAIRVAERRRDAARGAEREGAPLGEPSMRDLLAVVRAQALQVVRMPVTVGRRTFFVPLHEIEWMQADGNYVRLHLRQRSFLVRDTIRRLADALDPRQFVRVHRSVIVNVSRVVAIEPLVNGESRLTLAGGTTVNASRSYRQALVDALPTGP